MAPNSPQPDSGCDFCHREQEEYMHLEYGDVIKVLCGWHCVIAFAAVQAQERHTSLLQKLKEDDYDLYLQPYYEAGVI